MSSQLTIDISNQGVSFVSLTSFAVTQKYSVKFDSIQADAIKNQLNDSFEQQSFLGKAYDEITIAWSTNKSTLVPNNIFAESKPTDIFKLCFGDPTASYDVDYNRIAELSIVNIFEIPLWLKSYFVIKFPRVIIQQSGTHLIRKVMDANAFKLKATATIYNEYFHLTLVKHNNVEFYSFFDAQSAEDVIYHLMFTLQQKEMMSEKGSIELVPGVGCDDGLLNSIESGLSKIKDLGAFKVIIDPDLIPKAQILCV
ncbi:MAG: hypothetical protein ACI865_002144 [Flavobacteriaceae bacterium]|jgi:hypothetical protein